MEHRLVRLGHLQHRPPAKPLRAQVEDAEAAQVLAMAVGIVARDHGRPHELMRPQPQFHLRIHPQRHAEIEVHGVACPGQILDLGFGIGDRLWAALGQRVRRLRLRRRARIPAIDPQIVVRGRGRVRKRLRIQGRAGIAARPRGQKHLPLKAQVLRCGRRADIYQQGALPQQCGGHEFRKPHALGSPRPCRAPGLALCEKNAGKTPPSTQTCVQGGMRRLYN